MVSGHGSPAPVTGDTAIQSDVLECLSGARRYRAWLAGLAEPWLGDDPIEIGSGIGDYAAEWAVGRGRFTASEADEGRLAQLRRRFANDDRIRVRRLRAPIAEPASHSAVVAYNVLEHIDDDVDALRGFRGLLAPEGYVILIVPAFELAMSAFDREIGHIRRYRRSGLRTALEAAGFAVVRIHYVNAIGLPLWLAGMRLLRQRPHDGAALRLFDRLIVPISSRVERMVRPPFGQSVFAVAKAS